ncbi:MAG TPA: hypothetical protein VD995_02770 [Azospirillum sp.]|nr:hypothetical protein [Azospirillum sp.]
MSYSSPSLSPRHLRDHVIKPVLTHCAGDDARGFDSPAAVELVLGTAAHESKLRALDQITGPNDGTLGPAFGLWQMEGPTHDDIWRNFLLHRHGLAARIRAMQGEFPHPHHQLVTNLAYGAAMCRAHYFRRPEPLPAAGDLAGQAAYWKRHYNTSAGKGTPDQYVRDWRELVAPYL